MHFHPVAPELASNRRHRFEREATVHRAIRAAKRARRAPRD
jgi:hypothetical protein